jgi:Domain of unknown function (DUF4287)
MDEAKARKMFQAYLDNAEAKSGKTIAQMHAALKRSRLKLHAELRDFAKRQFGIGHGHAQAVVMHYLKPEFRTESEMRKPRPAAAKSKRPAAKK